jgi:hypothetical protein
MKSVPPAKPVSICELAHPKYFERTERTLSKRQRTQPRPVSEATEVRYSVRLAFCFGVCLLNDFVVFLCSRCLCFVLGDKVVDF